MALIVRHRGGVVLGAWLITRLAMLLALRPHADVAACYRLTGGWIERGVVPAGSALDVPIGARLLLALPRLFASSPDGYAGWLAFEMLICELALLYLLWRLAQWFSARDRELEPTFAILAYLGLTACLGRAPFEHIDLALMALVLGVCYCCVTLRRLWLADLLLALAIFVWVVPIALVPIYLAHISATADGGRWRLVARRALFIAGFSVALLAPFALGGLASLSLLSPHAGGVLDPDSTYGGVLLLANHLSGADWMAGFARGGPWILLTTQVALLAWVSRRIVRHPHPDERGVLVLRAVCACLALVLVAGLSFGLHHMVWLAPIAALLGGRALTAAALAFALSTFHALLPAGLPDAGWFAALLLVLRSAAVAWLVAELAAPGRTKNIRLDVSSRVLARLATVLVMVLAILVGLHTVEDNDVFIHMRVGADIWSSGSVPHTDVYSAVAAGREFIAHEWLSALVFFGVDRAFGGVGISLLMAACSLAVAATLYASLARPAREGILALPLVGLCTYLVNFRVHARPHLFSLVIVALFVLAIERWRRDRSARALWWLVPLQVVWVNLHGEYLLGPVLLAIVTGTVGLFALLPSLQRSVGPRAYSWSDVRGLLCLSAAVLLACLVNPYGPKILAFSFRMWSENDYIKQFVIEWRGTFLPENHGLNWFHFYCALLAVSWLALLARARTLPLLDLALLGAVTVLSAGSQRFVPHLALIGFPILVRSLSPLLESVWEKRALGRRPALELAAAMAMILYTTAYGYALDQDTSDPETKNLHRPIAWGYGEHPYEEVEFLERSGLEGIIYAEYTDAALLLQRLSPRIRPVVDSRIDIFGEELMSEYVHSQDSLENFYAYLAKHDCNLVMLWGYYNRHFVKALARDPSWRLAFRNNYRAIFVRLNPPTPRAR